MCQKSKKGNTPSSNSRMVALSIPPTLNKPLAEEWMASKASLLNFGFVVINTEIIELLHHRAVQSRLDHKDQIASGCWGSAASIVWR